MPQISCAYKKEGSYTAIHNYLLYLPENYEEKSDKKWPLILFLHGSGEQGDNVELLKKYGIPNIVESITDFQFIVVSPQCPNDTKWVFQTDALNEFLDYVLSNYNVDLDRVYLTGLSLGGHGTYKLAAEHPEKFAAIAPVCGHQYLEGVDSIKTLPVWVFHGAKDTVINVKESEEMVDALKVLGCDVRFTVYPEAHHDSWTETYNNLELYNWFLNHKKK
jgi:predicted peptidase